MFGKSPFQMFNLWISKWIWKHYASDATDARVRLNTNASLTPQREHDLLFSLLWFCVLYVYFLVNRFPVSFRLTLVLFLLFRNAFMQINFNILEDGILVEGIMWFFKIFIVNFRCFYFYRRAKIHLAFEKKYISESNMKWMFRWVRVLGNDACFHNRKRVIRGKGKRGEEKGGGDGRWR